MLRRVLERVSRNVVLKRRLPGPLGGHPLYVTPGAGLRYWRPSLDAIDPPLLSGAALCVKPGDVVWDIGANVGLFSFAAAGLAGASGRVLAVEADTQLVDLLRRSAALDAPGCAPVDTLCVAVSGEVGLARFHVAERSRATNHLEGGGSTQTGGTRHSYPVVTVTLDWLLEMQGAPNVVKIDVEGLERRLLEGASQLLERVRPRLMIEVSSEHCDFVSELLRSHAYTLYDLDDPRADRPATVRATANTLALPQ